MEKYSEKRQLGNLGEDLAEVFLVKQGFRVVERNYLKKWGELDIIAARDGLLHFLEVKSKTRGYVTREKTNESVSHYVSQKSFTKDDFRILLSRETDTVSDYMPEENVHFWKQKRMIRAIQTYLLDRNVEEDKEWQIDVITVIIDFLRKEAIIKHIENVVFEG